jgi:hypothetical protein
MSNLSTFTEIGLVDARASAGVLIVPRSSDIPGRVITYKDVYGAVGNSTIALLTSTGDTYEDGTNYRTLTTAYDFITLYAGSTSMWYTIGGTQFNGFRTNILSNNAFTTSSITTNTVTTAFNYTNFLYPQPGLTVVTTSNLIPAVNATTTGISIGNVTSNYLQVFSQSTFTSNIVGGSVDPRSTIRIGNTLIPAYSTNRISTINFGDTNNRWFQTFAVSTITSTLNADNAFGTSLSYQNISTQNITGFNLLGTTILSTQAIFCSSIQIGPQDAILDILGPLRTQDLSTITLQASTITTGTMTLNTLFGGPTVVNTTYTQNLYPLTTGAQVGFTTALAGLPGFYASGNFASTFTRVIQPTLDNDGFSNIVIINGSVSTPNMFTSTIFNRNFISTPNVVCSNLVGIGTGNSIFSQNFYPQGVNILGFGTGGPGNGPWDSASIRQTFTSSIITNNISTANILVSSIFTNNINASSLRVFGTLSTANMVVSSIVSGNFTLATGALVQKVVTSAVAPSGTVSLDLTQGNVFSFTTAMASSAAANFTTLNAVIGSTYYVNFLTGATPGNITFTGNTGATTLSATGSSLIGNPSVYIGLYGAAQSFTPAATTRYMFNCIVIAA